MLKTAQLLESLGHHVFEGTPGWSDETGEIAKMLMELGVEYMQGYYFSEPLNYRPWLNEGEYTPS